MINKDHTINDQHQLLPSFIDLFAGIGGIRMAFENSGAVCCFASEINKYARETYKAFFTHYPENDDIRLITTQNELYINHLVPDHDILAAGFPCQPFSLAGVSKKGSMGRPHGFDDPTQGTLFFDIKAIIIAKKPKVVFLENVKNLRSHNSRNTYRIIIDTLKNPSDGLEYTIADEIIDARSWVPQHRERIYIIAFRKDLGISENEIKSLFPTAPDKPPKDLDEIIIKNSNLSKYIVPAGTWSALIRHKNRHISKGQGFGYSVISPPYTNKITRTLSARYYKDGAEILINEKGYPRPRRLTPLECLRLMGFSKQQEEFFNGIKPQPVSDSQAYRQFGNSVVVPVVEQMARAIVNRLCSSLNITKILQP